MSKESAIKLFEHKRVRTHWDEELEKWYFSVIDVIEILSGSSIPKRYWSDLKKKLTSEGSEVYDKIVRRQTPLIRKHYCVSFNQFLRRKQNHLNNGWQK
jgi:hypothetical protein